MPFLVYRTKSSVASEKNTSYFVQQHGTVFYMEILTSRLASRLAKTPRNVIEAVQLMQ
jgi:hypothetical protein